ncbi:MAG: 4Fe-4S binding protein [Candidatus Altiarchaeota archaeon]
MNVKQSTLRRVFQALAVVATIWFTYLLYDSPMGVCWLDPFWHMQDVFSTGGGGASLFIGLERVDLANPATRLLVLSPFIIIGVFLLSTILFGRLFCGWLCPYGLILDAAERVSPIRGRYKIPGELKDPTIKLIILSGVLILAGLVEYTAFCDYCPAGAVFKGMTGHMIYTAVPVLLLTIILAMVYGRKTWCSYLCPLGGLMGLFTKYHVLPIRTVDACVKCLNCQKNCPMDVLVAEKYAQEGRNITDTECIKCMKCVEACPKRILRFP